MKNTKVISIIGGTVWGNRGAESMLVTTIGRIRKRFPDAKFNIFSYYAQKDRQLLSDPEIQVFNSSPFSLGTRHFLGAVILKILSLFTRNKSKGKFLQASSALNNSDVLLDIGGITFSDGREKFLPFNILTIWPAMILNVPVVKLAQAVGPFKHALNRFAAKLYLPRCQKIFARGEASYLHIFGLGLTENIADRAADIAFLYDRKYSLSNENADRITNILSAIHQEKQAGKKIIVVSPSILVEKKLSRKGIDSTGLFLHTVRALHTKEYFFVFFPNSTREGSTKKHNNDIVLIEKLKDALNTEEYEDVRLSISLIDFDINTAAIREIVKTAHILVTSRYHAMISGLALSVPTIVLGWGHKYLETMASFGLSSFVMHAKDKKFDLVEKIHSMEEQYGQLLDSMKAALPGVIKQAEGQFQYLDRMLQQK